MSTDFDFVYEPSSGRTYRYIERLEDDERERALRVVAVGVERSRIEMGLVPVPRKRSPSQSLCGCPDGFAREEHGVTYCARCSGEVRS